MAQTLRPLALVLALAGCGGSSIRPLPSATPDGCPYRATGESSWVRVIVLSTTGDTLPDADVALAPRDRDTTYWISTERAGQGFGFGPLRAASYILRVEHRGFASAQRTVSFCKDQEAHFVARLKPRR